MLTFRKAQETDIERIWEIYLENHILEEEGKAVIGWNRNIYPTRKTAEEAYLRNDLFVSEDETGVVGTAVINHEQMDVYPLGNWQYDAPPDRVMVLHTLVISTRASGKGYGRKFVDFYEQYALENECPYLRMDTNERNVRARNLYRKLGYREIGIVPCTFHSMTGINMVLLEKKL
ncbi:MAG: GNAT family N-acetyltransferase [Clostridia bacterium]|nr:GNAT family N-acetyltransferase [Clostridia bacterium]